MSQLFAWELGYLFHFSLVSWGKLVLLSAFPLAVFLLNPIGSGLLCFHLRSFLCIFWFCFLFLLWFVGYSAACCSACICLCFESFFPCSWHILLPYSDQKRCLEWFQFFEFTKARFMTQEVIYLGEDSVCTRVKGEIHCFGVKCPIDIH